MFPICLLLLAVQQPSPSPSVAPKPEAKVAPATVPTPKPPTKGQRKFMQGTLGSLNVEQRTIRFSDLEGREHIWPVDARLAEAQVARAADIAKLLQPGDPITVVYHEDDGKPMIVEIGKRAAEGEGREGPRND